MGKVVIGDLKHKQVSEAALTRTPVCPVRLRLEVQTHQEVAQALIVKNFALVRLRQLFAQLDCLLPHLQKKRKGGLQVENKAVIDPAAEAIPESLGND